MRDNVDTKGINGPLSLVREGKRQLIRISHITMLKKIMNVLGARATPVFTEIDCGAQGVKVSINFDLSSGTARNITVIEGSPMKEKYSAEINAAMEAFKHIDQHLNIQVLDFSSRIVKSIGAYKTNLYISEAIEVLNNLLNKFDIALTKSRDFSMQLYIQELKAKFSEDILGNAVLYGELSYSLSKLVKSFSTKMSGIRSRLAGLDFDLIKHHQMAKDKRKIMSSKRYSKTVVLPAKHLLDFVMCYFGLGKATYVNGPYGSDQVKSMAQFNIPYMQHLKFCGAVNVKGVGDTSINAEENAAYNALLLIEGNFKAKIVDLNHDERLEAENIQKTLAKMLEGIIDLGEGVKDMWEKFNNEVQAQRVKYSNEAETASKTLISEKEISAYHFCSDVMNVVVQRSEESYEDCLGPFERLNEISDELNKIKLRLEIM